MSLWEFRGFWGILQRSRVVLKTPVQADAAQFKAMRDIIGGENNRPVQPLNDREVNEDK